MRNSILQSRLTTRIGGLPAGAGGWLRAACALLALAALALGGVLLPGSPAPVLAQTASGGGPPAPTGVTAEPVSTTTIALTWSAPRDSGRVRGYRVESSPDGGDPWTTLADVLDATAYSHTGLTGGTTRHYRVYSLSIGAIGEPSAVALTATHVHVPDANLRAALGAALAIRKTDPVILADLAALTTLAATSTGIVSIRGLEHAAGLTSLDLGQNSISDVSPLAGLTGLTSLDLAENSVSDVSPLAGLTGLTSLDLAENSVSDIAPLSSLVKLEVLQLWYNEIADIEAVRGLTRLEELHLGGNSVSDVEALSGLTSLEVLHLWSNEIEDEDLAHLSGLTRLTKLHLYSNTISDVSPLSGLTDLETLGLWNNEIEDIAPLSGLTNLKWLDISDNKISDDDLAPLEGLTLLEYLDLGKSRSDPDTYLLSDIAPLARLVNLKELHLERNTISDVTPLTGLTGLTKLHLYSNTISDLGPLTGLAKLEELLLGGNPISDLTPLSTADLNSLEVLHLWRCEIEDVSPLAGLAGLRVLHLYGNRVEDVSPLSSLTGLEELHLAQNSISDTGPLTGLADLTLLHLWGNHIVDVSPLAANSGLGEGDEVILSGNPLSDASIATHIPELEGRGVAVRFTPAPPAPAGLTARASGPGAVRLSWAAWQASTTTASVTGYRVEWSPSGAESWTAFTPALAETPTRYRDSGLSAGTTRYYRVFALSSVGDSLASDVVMATTAPTEADAPILSDGLTVIAVGRAVLTFSPGSGAYRARVSSDAGGCGEQAGAGAAPGTLLSCLRVEIFGADGERLSRLSRPVVMVIELASEQVEDAGGAGLVFQEYLRGDMRLLTRAPGDPWKDVPFEVDVARAGGVVTARAQVSGFSDFALVLTARAAAATPEPVATPAAVVTPAAVAPPEPEPPSTGDESVPTAVRLALLASLALVVVGGVLAAGATWRMRRKGKKAAAPTR